MLREIYRIFAAETAELALACGPGCATCCTRSVTLTTAEGRLLVDYLVETGGVWPVIPRDRVGLRPALTTNGLAACYLAGQEGPEEPDSPWLFEPCFFLRAGRCSVYPARPFACRSFVSTVRCGNSGLAETPEWLLTLTIVTNQLLEHLDRGGYWGNLADVLGYLGGGEADAADWRLLARKRLLPTLPLPGLLVVPEELSLVDSYLAKLGQVTGLNLTRLLPG